MYVAYTRIRARLSILECGCCGSALNIGNSRNASNSSEVALRELAPSLKLQPPDVHAGATHVLKPTTFGLLARCDSSLNICGGLLACLPSARLDPFPCNIRVRARETSAEPVLA